MSEYANEGWVRVAQLVRPQGRHGELLAEILTDFPERFAERRRLFLGAPGSDDRQRTPPREVALERHWLHKGRLVLKFAGVDTIEAANALRGFDLLLPLAERAPLVPGAVYIGDLVGCLLYDRASGRSVGRIEDVDRETTNMDLLVVRALKGRPEILIPFAKAYEPMIDLATRRMEMTLPEGLLSLDTPPAEQKPGAGKGQSD